MRILPASAYAKNSAKRLIIHCDSRSVWHRSRGYLPQERNNTIIELDAIRSIGRESDLVELLALTACQTVVGDDRAALGLAGVAVQAGVRSALASLWFIQDAPTVTLVTQFYDS